MSRLEHNLSCERWCPAGRRLPPVAVLIASGLLASLLGGCASSNLLSSSLAPAETGSIKSSARKRAAKRSAVALVQSVQATKGKAAAFQTSKKLVKELPEDRGLAQYHGLLALDLGDAKTAERVLARLASDGHSDWRTHSALGSAIAAQGRRKAALKSFKKALALSPENPVVLNNMAIAYAMTGETKMALHYLAKAERHATTKSAHRKIVQNTALMAGLEGRFEDYRRMARTAMPRGDVDRNVVALRKFKPRKVASKSKVVVSNKKTPARQPAPTSAPKNDPAPKAVSPKTPVQPKGPIQVSSARTPSKPLAFERD